MEFQNNLSTLTSSAVDSEDSSCSPKSHEESGEVIPRRVFSCRRCSYKTDRKNNLKRHMTAMHEFTAQKLECCGLRFLNKADLKNHNGKYHAEGYKCPVCHQHFVRKALLERHFSVHTGEKKFACECGYRTSHKSNLERHYKTHLKDAFFKDSYLPEKSSPSILTKDKSFLPSMRGCMTYPKARKVSGSSSLIRPHQNRLSLSCVPYSLCPSNSLPILDKNSFVRPESSVISPKKTKRGFTVEELLKEDDQENNEQPKRDSSPIPLTSSSQNSSPSSVKRPQPRHLFSNMGLEWSQALTSVHESNSHSKVVKPQPMKLFRSYSAFEPLLLNSKQNISKTSLPTQFKLTSDGTAELSKTEELSTSSSSAFPSLRLSFPTIASLQTSLQSSYSHFASSSSTSDANAYLHLPKQDLTLSPTEILPCSSKSHLQSVSYPSDLLKVSPSKSNNDDMEISESQYISNGSYVPKKWRLRKPISEI